MAETYDGLRADLANFSGTRKVCEPAGWLADAAGQGQSGRGRGWSVGCSLSPSLPAKRSHYDVIRVFAGK